LGCGYHALASRAVAVGILVRWAAALNSSISR
jgi:hypothetical protein